MSDSLIKTTKAVGTALIMKEYEIWVGYYDLGMEFGRPNEPQLVSKVPAISFRVACFKHELDSLLRSISKQELGGCVNEQSLEWFYDKEQNSNNWTGRYYETREEALKSFNE
jgi:hypothetical protein